MLGQGGTKARTYVWHWIGPQFERLETTEKNGYLETCTIGVFCWFSAMLYDPKHSKTIGIHGLILQDFFFAGSDDLSNTVAVPSLVAPALSGRMQWRSHHPGACPQSGPTVYLPGKAVRNATSQVTKHIEGHNISGGKQRKAVKPTALDLNHPKPM